MFSALRMMMSLRRPVMRTFPAASIVPRSPVWNHPSASNEASSSVAIDVAGEASADLEAEARLLAPLHRRCPLVSTARTETPDAGRPTDVVRISTESVGCRGRGVRELGESPAADEGHAEHRPHFVVDLGGNGGTAEAPEPQGGKERRIVGRCRAASRYARKNGTAVPSTVGS